MESKIKFSVLVPVYNAEKYLSQCIQSILSQSYDNFELILVNDGSQDQSEKICKQYAEQDDRIKYFSKGNEGALATRIFAVNQATGEYVVYVDADDYLKEKALEKLFSVIVETGSECVIYGFDRVNDFGEIYSSTAESETVVLTDKRDIYCRIFNNQSYNSMCRKAVKRALFKTSGYQEYYTVTLGEDLLQSLEILKKTNSVVFLKDILYKYRQNMDSAVHSIRVTNYKVNFIVREAILRFLQEEKVFSATDYDEHRNYSIVLLVGEIFCIARFETTFKTKKGFFVQIRQSSYFNDFLAKGLKGSSNKRDKLIFGLFKKRCYRMIIFIIKVFDWMKGRNG